MFRNVYRGKRVFITGHTEFKGSWLTMWLLGMAAEVYGYPESVPTKPSIFDKLAPAGRITHHQRDIRNASELKASMLAFNPDFAFHLAAQTIVSASYDDPLSTNIIGTANELESLRSIDYPCVAVLITPDKCYENVEWVRDAAHTLTATSIDLVSIGLDKEVASDLWSYIYDDDIFASRVYSPSVKSPDNAPSGCTWFQFEIYTRGASSRFDASELKENCIYALKKFGIAGRQDVAVIDHRRHRYGNVIFDADMEEQREIVREFLVGCDVQSKGRFGKWDYLWSNQSLLSGYGAEI